MSGETADGTTNVLYPAKHRTMLYRRREKACRKRFSVKVGTAMDGSNLGYRAWAAGVCPPLTGLRSMSTMKLHRGLNTSQKSARHLAHRPREASVSDREAFGGPVQEDRTDRTVGAIAGMDGNRLRYNDPIADNGLDSGAQS